MRTTVPTLIPLLALLLALLLAPAPCPAQSQQEGPAKWKAEEERCLSQCPQFPRFSGTETDEQYRQRLKQEDAYNACQKECARQYLEKNNIPQKAFDDGTQGYYERNKDLAPEYPNNP